MEQLVIDQIRAVTNYASQCEDEFVRMVGDSTHNGQGGITKKINKDLGFCKEAFK